ncbi:hypothetical protein ACN47E_007593 [Coniothyrium glycines]
MTSPIEVDALAETTTASILYQNSTQDVFLLDIPTSIAAAQGRSDTLLSTPPLEQPIHLDHVPQPKMKQAETHKSLHACNTVLHSEYKALIESALAEIRAHVSNSWCTPRQLMSPAPINRELQITADAAAEKELETRLKEWSAWTESKGDDVAFDLQQMMASLGATADHGSTAAAAVPHTWLMSHCPAHEFPTGTQAAGSASQQPPTEPWQSSFHNPESQLLELTIAEPSSQHGQLGQRYRFTIPPGSTLFLSDTSHPDAFRATFREITDQHNLPRHFDLVLLDPPWPNRSAKRKGAYDQVGGMPFVKRMLLRLDIDNYLKHNALVGIWITNKESLREHVLGPGGLFETWNVGLVEEWIWIKTTTQGEPMFDIDNAMRKPYEILLLGRAAPNSWTTMTHAQHIQRRVIAAVPDIHSRKPCLKELFEQYMPDQRNYTALEVFPRCLVSGWTSWGNEVIKYNWDRYWTSGNAAACS